MTDEEMAEEYLEKLRKEKIPFDIYEVNNQLKRAFLAGLKAGRPEWHKVAAGDLPKIGKPCLVHLANDATITARLREDNVWTTDGHNAFESVIVWCEIPPEESE
jgi:hypothetical protein